MESSMEDQSFISQKVERLNNPIRSQDFPIDFVIETAPLSNPQIMIDLGAGTAFFSAPLARLFPDCKIYACDISQAMIDWIKTNIVPHCSNIIPLTIEPNCIPLADGVADFIFMVNLHHELDDPHLTLNQCFRLLKPKGKIAVSDWKKEKTERGPAIDRRCDPDKVKDQLASAGFGSIRLYQDFPNNFMLLATK